MMAILRRVSVIPGLFSDGKAAHGVTCLIHFDEHQDGNRGVLCRGLFHGQQPISLPDRTDIFRIPVLPTEESANRQTGFIDLTPQIWFYLGRTAAMQRKTHSVQGGKNMNQKIKNYLKRLGFLGFMFFFLKGLGWLAVFYFGIKIFN